MVTIKPMQQGGQGMVEYIIIVALIALAAIAAFSYFGKGVRGQVSQMTSQISGKVDDDSGITTAQKAADGAKVEADTNVDLGNYDERDQTTQ